MNNQIDTNIKNYTIADIFIIFQLPSDNINASAINNKYNELISKCSNNPKLLAFLEQCKSQLLQYIDNDNSHKEGFANLFSNSAADSQTNQWFQNQVLPPHDANQAKKITNRKNSIQLLAGNHVPMKREQIATTDTYQVPIKQDSLNPNLKNTINRFINLDSQFRQYSIDSESTSYTLDLSDLIKNVLKISIYSYSIPYTWYNIDEQYGTTCFWIKDKNNTDIYYTISIPSGSYNSNSLMTALNAAFTAMFSNVSPTAPTPIQYNSVTGKIIFYLDGWKNINDHYVINSIETEVVFYDFTYKMQCNNTCGSKNHSFFNTSLGWILGFRTPQININILGNTASAILDLNGTKYLILSIDDYNQNRVNNSLVSITQLLSTLKMPSYFTPEIQVICTDAAGGTAATGGTDAAATAANDANDNLLFNNNALLLAGKFDINYHPLMIAQPGQSGDPSKRSLTQSQLYTINEINRNNNTRANNFLAKAPTTSDIMGILPIKIPTNALIGAMLIENGGTLQDNTRTYFGPVNIDRLTIRLLNDKGDLINLNGADWSITLIAECLYQY